MSPSTVRAAGLVLLRERRGLRQVLVLHRPHRRDWSLPKGKLDPGEHILECAVRECDEETGIVPVLDAPLGRQEYQAMGRPKTVDYWVGRVGQDDGFTPDDEVREIRWLTMPEAADMLTYRRDVEFVEDAMRLPTTAPLLIARHAAAVKRDDFEGPDLARPLSGKGRTQARALTSLLSAYGIRGVHSSDAARCTQTVRPFAEVARRTIEQEPQFSEPGFEANPQAALDRLESLFHSTRRLALCSHRPVLPALFEALMPYAAEPARGLLASVAHRGLAPGAFVVVHRAVGDGSGRIVAVEHSGPKRAPHRVRRAK